MRRGLIVWYSVISRESLSNQKQDERSCDESDDGLEHFFGLIRIFPN